MFTTEDRDALNRLLRIAVHDVTSVKGMVERSIESQGRDAITVDSVTLHQALTEILDGIISARALL